MHMEKVRFPGGFEVGMVRQECLQCPCSTFLHWYQNLIFDSAVMGHNLWVIFMSVKSGHVWPPVIGGTDIFLIIADKIIFNFYFLSSLTIFDILLPPNFSVIYECVGVDLRLSSENYKLRPGICGVVRFRLFGKGVSHPWSRALLRGKVFRLFHHGKGHKCEHKNVNHKLGDFLCNLQKLLPPPLEIHRCEWAGKKAGKESRKGAAETGGKCGAKFNLNTVTRLRPDNAIEAQPRLTTMLFDRVK